jgi:hypothetical protein
LYIKLGDGLLYTGGQNNFKFYLILNARDNIELQPTYLDRWVNQNGNIILGVWGIN